MIKKYKHKLTGNIVTGVQWNTKNLQQIEYIFNDSNVQYIYNQLFIDNVLVDPFDYCIINQLYDMDVISQKRFNKFYEQYHNTQPKKVLSCGGIIKYQNKILIVHSTNNKYWNFPKGQIQSGESPIYAARRQIKQETNINVSTSIYKDLGEHEYLSNKNIHLFLFILDKLPTNVKCTSMFQDKLTMKLRPEIDNFKWVTVEQSLNYLGPSIMKVFKQILKKYPQIDYPQVRYVTP